MKRFHFGMLAAATLLAPAVTAFGQCPAGEIADCNGACAPETWVGDGYCDDGTYAWNGVPIFFNCEAFGNDGGDCGTTDCTIPAGTSTEAEACGEDLNGGCNGGAYQPIVLHAEVAGTFWADADTRDTDWYEITLTEPTELSLEIYSNIPSFAAVVAADCSGIVGAPTAGACPGVTSVCVTAGTYYIVALPSVFTGFPCGGVIPADYTLAVHGMACDATPPANDTCAGATVAVEGFNPFDNSFANTDWGVPSCGFNGAAFTKDVFFTFTPAVTGYWALETCSGAAPFDTGIEVYDACPEAGGVQIACNDDGAGCAAYASSLVFEGTAGVTYTILVGGWNGAAGATDLVIAASAGACPAGQIEDCNGNCAPENWVADGYCDDGTYTFGGNAICLNCEAFAFDGGDCAVQGDCNGGGGGGGGGGCGTGGDCCVAGTAPGCADVECCTLICAADAFCCDTQWDQLCADAAVAGCANCGGGGGGDPPANDNCDAAATVALGDHPFDSTGATTDGNNPTDAVCGAFGAGFFNDVWFSFTAATADNFTASTCNQASFDTRIDILDGCGGTLLACNDDGDGCAGFSSLVTFPALAGQTVLIRVGGYGAADSGTGTLSITAEGGGGGGGGTPGLTCADAIVIASGDTAFNRAGATEDLDYTGTCDMGQFGTDTNFNVIWHSFSPTQSGTYTVSTCNTANHDTRLSVQTGCEASTVIACNDDGAGCATYTSMLTFDAVCDQTYYIMVGGYSATTALGTGTMSVTGGGTDCGGSACAGDFNTDGMRDGADLGVLLAAFGVSSAGDMNGDGVTDGSDLGAFLAVFGSACP